MIARVLIVVLAVLNLGAALWWGLHRPVPANAATALPPGVARLQLWREAPAQAPVAASAPEEKTGMPVADSEPVPAAPAKTAQTVAATADVPARPDTPVQPRCYSYGPYPDRAAAQDAKGKLGPVERAVLRELPVPATPATSYRVFLPSDAAATDATVAKLKAAGIADYYVIRAGEKANGIALGLYRKRDGAELRQAELRKAGIEAKIETQGAPASQWWLDAAFAGKAPEAESGRRQSLDCASMR